MSLQLQFTNNTGLADDQVFVTVQNRAAGVTDTDITYGSGSKLSFASGNIMSESLSLEEIGAGGFTIHHLDGAILFVSYGARLTATTKVPSFIGSGGSDYKTRFQSFELTMVGGDGNQGNMTAINYFTAPMSIESFGGATSLQKVSYVKTAAEIGAELAKLTAQDSNAVVKDADGRIIRYIGPSSYGAADSNPYQSFKEYLDEIARAEQATKIQNHNAFNQPPSKAPGYINYDFALDLTAKVSESSILLTGSITSTVAPGGAGGTLDQTFADCSVTIDRSDDGALKYTIYGQAFDPAQPTVTWGSGWDKLGAYMQEKGLAPQGTLLTTKNLAIGEITSGLVMGFVNSATIPQGGSTPLKDMASKAWWALDPMIGFDGVQSASTNYNPYAAVLFNASNNEVYSIPYSDRMGTGPLVDSVLHDHHAVDKWVVTLEAPVSVPK